MPFVKDTLHLKRASILSGFALLLLSAGATSARAQALATASKSLDLSAFGGFTYQNPDYGPQHNKGYTFGVNATRYFGWKVDPSIEIRMTGTSGDTVKEKSYLAGVRLQADFHRRYHPYADFLAGIGTIHFVHPSDGYLGDRGTTYSYGGGVDIDLVRNFQAKVDFQGQSWSFDRHFTVSPTSFTVGVAYRIPFKPHRAY